MKALILTATLSVAAAAASQAAAQDYELSIYSGWQTAPHSRVSGDYPGGGDYAAPLGWDGKPIPYWLFKLHGLGVEYKCEVCSDYVYQGRKNFEKHFSESRHAFGMRALGLPNTKHFHEITKIADALARECLLCVLALTMADIRSLQWPTS